MNAFEKFYAERERWVTSPETGIKYKIGPLRQAAVLRLLGTIPAIPTDVADDSVAPVEAKASRAETEANVSRNAEYACACVREIEYDGVRTTEIPPASDFPSTDIALLIREIDKPIATSSPAAEDARGVLPVS